MIKTSDGSIISSAHNSTEAESQANRTFSLYRARIDRIIYIDDADNKTRRMVEYDIVIDGTVRDGTKYYNVPALTGFGGFNNYSEQVFDDTNHTFTSKPDGDRKPYSEVTNGSYVAILFLYGNDETPVIIGGWPHPRNKGAKRVDGQRMKGEFNGIEWEINKDGELTLTSLGGPRTGKGDLTNSDRGPSTIKFEQDGTILINRNDNTTIQINDDEIILTRGNNRIKINDDYVDLGGASDLTAIEGLVTGQSIDPFTGAPHIDISQKVRGKK